MKLYLIIGSTTLLLHSTIVVAWTQYQNFGHRLFNTVLRLREKDDVEVERTRLETLWGVTDEDDFVSLFGNYEQIKSLPVGEWTEGVSSDWSDVGPCFGDECDQCEIPADFKDDSVNVDVLDFLGITRAEPIRVQKRL